MSDDLRAAIEKFADCSVYNPNPYIRGLASEYAKKLLAALMGFHAAVDVASSTKQKQEAPYED